METTCSSETSIDFLWATCCSIWEDIPNKNRFKNVKSYTLGYLINVEVYDVSELYQAAEA
jgi:hypothetical protein